MQFLKKKAPQVDIINRKIPLRLDITMLNMIIGIIFKTNSIQITKKSLINIKKLFDIIDENVFEHNDQMKSRFYFIKRALAAKLDLGFENDDAILNYCKSDTYSKDGEEIVRNLEYYTRLKADEIKYINKAVEDRLQYSYLFLYKDPIYNTIERLDSGTYDSFAEINEDLMGILTKLMTEMKKSRNIDKSNSLSLDDEDIDAKMEDMIKNIQDPSSMVFTGIQKLNQILAPAFLSKRLYVILGLPANFKSGILISIAYWAKLYSPNIKSKQNKRPTILYVTLENDVEETLERIFNMTVTGEDIRNFAPKEAVKMLKEKGQFYLKNDEDVNICIKYFGNREIDTWDLCTIIDDLADEGKEVVLLILDYLKRIRPHERAKDEKEELKHITNELKNIAIEYNIPVISAHQLNRDGQRVVDEGAIRDKADLTHMLGRSNVGSAFEIIENSDWSCIINFEKKKDTDQHYLTFKRIKIRYRDPNDEFYFNHPFEIGNKMRLIPDIHLKKSLSEASLSTDMEAVNLGRGRRHAVNREIDNSTEDVKAGIFNNEI